MNTTAKGTLWVPFYGTHMVRKCICAVAIVVLVIAFDISHANAASSWNPTVLVNTTATQVIDDMSSSDLSLQFGVTLDKSLTYDRTASRFMFDAPLYVTGSLGVSGTASGAQIHAEQTLTSSGQLVVEGNLTFGDALGDAITVNAGSWTFANDTNFALSGGQNGLSFDTNTLSIDAASDRIGIGTTTPETTLETIGTMSGVSLTVSSLKNCDTIDTNGNGVLACGTDNGGSGSPGGSDTHVQFNDATAFGGDADFRWDKTSNVLTVAGTASGRTIHAQDQLRSSGSLVVEGTTAFRNIPYTWPTNGTSGSGLVLTLSGSSTNQLSWTGPIIKRINGNTGAAGPYMTWQNLTANSTACSTTALCTSVMSTTGIGVGTWKFKYTLFYETAATTTGIGFGVNHTGTATTPGLMWHHITTGGAAATGIGDDVSATSAGQLSEGKSGLTLNAVIGSATAGVATANANIAAVLEGVVVVTATGTLELKIASEVAASNVLINDDSTLELIKIQ